MDKQQEQRDSRSVFRQAEDPVFTAPWEGQAFAAAVALRDRALLHWPDFADYLSAEIAAAADSEAEADGADYYRHWLRAMERLLLDKGLVTDAELAQRRNDVAAARRRDHSAPDDPAGPAEGRTR